MPTFYRTAFNSAALFLILSFVDNMGSTYYEALRLYVPLIAVLLAIRSISTRRLYWLVVSAASIYLWLPTFHVYFQRSVWLPIDFLFAALFTLAGWQLGKPQVMKKSKTDEPTRMENPMRDKVWVFRVGAYVLMMGLYNLCY